MTRRRTIAFITAATVVVVAASWWILSRGASEPAAPPRLEVPAANAASGATEPAARGLPAAPIRSQPLPAEPERAPPFTIVIPNPPAPPEDDSRLRVTFLVVDRAGQPIEHARVFAGDVTSPPTGSDGTTTCRIAPDTAAVVAGAPNHAVESFPLGRPLDSPVRLVLPRAAVLVVRVRHEQGQAFLRGVVLCVSYAVFGDAEIAAEGSHEFADVRIARAVASHAVVSGGAIKTSVQTHCYPIAPDRDVTISGFTPGDVATVRVEDRFGGTLIEKSIPLAQEEATAIELVLVSTPRSVRGRLVDELGGPVRGAKIGVAGKIFVNDAATTDEDGRFEIEDVYQQEPLVMINATGFVPRLLPWRDDDGDVSLEAARDIRVRLVGGSNAAWGGTVSLDMAGTTHGASLEGDHAFRLTAVPRRPGTIRVKGPTREVTQAVGPHETEVELARPE